jgi:thioesterase domain-containing protein/acyl carrier protein
LYIGGAGVADGYLDDPEATAAKFVPDPFQPQPGNRLYKTGDVVRFLHDGNLEFMGRADHQIKIRGFRIEPGEIEATLRLHPDISQAIVVPCTGQSGDKYLAAYVVPAAGVVLTPEELQRHATGKLPAYMVPSSWVILAELPLNRNGKVDRAALPSPVVKVASGQVYELLEPAERRLADIWEQALGKEVRSTTDDFFDLGGHSLTAVRVLTHIEKVFGAALPLTTLFRARTLGQMAREIRDEAAKKPLPTLIPIREGGSLPPLFCVSRPNVNALGYMLLARKFGEEQPVYGLQAHLRNPDLEPYTQKEYERKAAEYITALREVQPHGPYFLVGYCEGAHIAFEMVRQLEDDGEPIGMLAILDAWPQENTRNRFLFHIHLYIRQIRKFLKSDYRNQVNNLRRKLGKLVPRASGTHGPSQTPSAPRYFLQMTQRYWPGPDYVAPQCNAAITVYRTSGQPFWRIRDRRLGWGVRTRSNVKVLDVPGAHRSVLREPCVTILAQEINAQMQKQLVTVDTISERVAS